MGEAVTRAVVAFLLLFAWPAHGHGDATWIMSDQTTRWCCGPQDCFELQSVISTPAGWAFSNPQNGSPVVVPYQFPSRYPSINEHFWACFYPSGSVRCFFTSPEGV